MFKKLLGVIDAGRAVPSTAAAAQLYQPYAKATSANEIYDLLFCDYPSDFQPKLGSKPTDWQLLVFGPHMTPQN